MSREGKNTDPGGMRHAARPILASLVFLLAGAGVLAANGGTLRVSDAPAGPYRVSVYTDPTPPRPDSVDVSVLIVRADGYESVDGLDVEVLGWPRAQGAGPSLAPSDSPPTGRDTVEDVPQPRIGPADATVPTIRVRATRDQADDRRYYAAKFSPGTPGPWRFVVRVQGPEGGGSVAFEMVLRQPRALEDPWIVLVLALLPLAALGWWLIRGGRTEETGRPAHP